MPNAEQIQVLLSLKEELRFRSAGPERFSEEQFSRCHQQKRWFFTKKKSDIDPAKMVIKPTRSNQLFIATSDVVMFQQETRGDSTNTNLWSKSGSHVGYELITKSYGDFIIKKVGVQQQKYGISLNHHRFQRKWGDVMLSIWSKTWKFHTRFQLAAMDVNISP